MRGWRRATADRRDAKSARGGAPGRCGHGCHYTMRRRTQLQEADRARQQHKRGRLRRGREAGKQAERFIGDASGQIDRSQTPACATVAVDQIPQIAVHQWQAVDAVDRAEECARVGIKHVDRAVAKVADQQVATEVSEAGGRNIETPRRIQHAIGNEPLPAGAVEVEAVDVPVAGPCNIIVPGWISCRCESDVELAVRHQDIERGITRGHRGIGDRVHHYETVVIDFHCAGTEIGNIEQ